MGRKKKPIPDDPEQSAKFIEFAEKLQDEDAAERFEEAMKRIVAFKPERQEKTKAKPPSK